MADGSLSSGVDPSITPQRSPKDPRRSSPTPPEEAPVEDELSSAIRAFRSNPLPYTSSQQTGASSSEPEIPFVSPDNPSETSNRSAVASPSLSSPPEPSLTPSEETSPEPDALDEAIETLRVNQARPPRPTTTLEPPPQAQTETQEETAQTPQESRAANTPKSAPTVQEPVAPKRVEPLTSSQDLRAAAAQRQANQATVDESTAQNTSETPSITPDDLDQAIKEFQGDQAKSTPPTPTPSVRAPLSPLPTPSVARSATAAASEQAPSDDTIELTDEDIVAEDTPLEESDDLAAAIEEFQAKRVVTPSPLPQRPAAQTQAAPTNDIEELTEADMLPDEAPAEARAETATAETESDDLAAAIEELQAKQALSEQSASAQLPQNESISPLPKAPATPSIRAERTRLREAKTQAESRQRLLAAYNERLQTGSLKILHERYPKQERAWRSLSKTLGGSVDAFALVPPEARSQIHLQAVIETRAAFPDLTEVALSALLDDVAREQMAALQQNALMQAVAAGAEATLTAQSLAHLGMGRALVQVAQQTLSHADALRQNETRLTERGTALRQGRGAEASEDPAEADRLRAQQQQDANARHGLQIALRASLGNLETLAAGAQAAEQAVASRQSPDQVALLLGETLAVAAPQHASATPSMGRSSGDPTTPEAFHAQQASALRSAQARSAMQRIPTTRGSRTAARSSLDVAGDTPPDPLLQLPQEPNSPQASFSRAQRAMTERQRQFLGTTRRGSGGGYEAMFGLAGAGAMTSDTEGDGDTPILEEGENVYLDDVDLREQAQAEELAYQQQEARQQEAQEQAAAEEEARPDQASPQDLMNKADTVQKIAKNPAVQKLLTGSGMALTAVLAIFIVILIILWLNLRLIAPKEGSLLRKPLSGMGTFGVILLDIATAVIILISTLITAAILFLPIAPFAFALGAVPPSLQSVFMTGFNWVTTAIFR